MLAGAGAGAAPAAAAPFTVQTLHFDTIVGPGNDHHCDVIADLYRPADATASHPAPAVLATNGFGGSKNDQAFIGNTFAANGYVVLSYSGLGFGGSGCKVTLDDPDWDGKAASQLIRFLGGTGTAVDGTRVDYVRHDAVAHDGRHYDDDPRVGMIGGSYGGQIQFAAAADDPRLDTIVPIVTWNDLRYAIFPNNADLAAGVTSRTPGVLKYVWGLFFTGEGAAIAGLQGAPGDPSRLAGCPNFPDAVCSGLAQSILGAPSPGLAALLGHASVASYIDRIKIPVMLWQGEHDSLFNLSESVATYRALRARDVPVKLLWQRWGHTDGTAAPGEITRTAHGDVLATYEGQVAKQWFDHYLKDAGPAPDLDFSFYRDWVPGNAQAAYATVPEYPAGAAQRLYLSGTSGLTDAPGDVAAGRAAFLAPPLAAPTSLSELSTLNDNVVKPIPTLDVPGTFAKFATPPLGADTDVVGVPTVHLRIAAPLATLGNALGPNGHLTLFLKLYDVAPDGRATLPAGIAAPARLPVTRAAFDISLPGIVHRFAAGHRIALVVAGDDASYRGSPLGGTVTILTDATNPSTLSVPLYTPSAPEPPSLSRVRIRPPRFRAVRLGHRGGGAIVRYRDSQAATTTWTVQRIIAGRAKRTRHVGTLRHRDRAGTNKVRLTGRFRGRPLPRGRYRLVGTPRMAGRTGRPVTATFRILR